MDDGTQEQEPADEGSGRGLILLVVGVLVFVGCFFFLMAGSSVDSARVIDSGAAERVSGMLARCPGRASLVSGDKWCLEHASERLDDKAIDVAWPDFKELRRFEGEEVVGLADDGWLIAFELNDGSVVRGTNVGWRGVVYWGSVGLGFLGAALWVGYAVRLGDRWRDSLALRFRWKWGLLTVATLSAHATMLPVAVVGDVIWSITTALVVRAWLRDTNALPPRVEMGAIHRG